MSFRPSAKMNRRVCILLPFLVALCLGDVSVRNTDHSTKTGSLSIPEKIIGGVIDIVHNHKNRPQKPSENGGSGSGGVAGGNGVVGGGAASNGYYTGNYQQSQGNYQQSHGNYQQSQGNYQQGQGIYQQSQGNYQQNQGYPQTYPGQWVFPPYNPQYPPQYLPGQQSGNGGFQTGQQSGGSSSSGHISSGSLNQAQSGGSGSGSYPPQYPLPAQYPSQYHPGQQGQIYYPQEPSVGGSGQGPSCICQAWSKPMASTTPIKKPGGYADDEKPPPANEVEEHTRLTPVSENDVKEDLVYLPEKNAVVR